MKGFRFRYLSAPFRCVWVGESHRRFWAAPTCLMLSAEQRQKAPSSNNNTQSNSNAGRYRFSLTLVLTDRILYFLYFFVGFPIPGKSGKAWLFKDWICWLLDAVSYHSIISLKWFALLLGKVLVALLVLPPHRLPVLRRSHFWGWLLFSELFEKGEPAQSCWDGSDECLFKDYYLRRDFGSGALLYHVWDLLDELNGCWFSYSSIESTLARVRRHESQDTSPRGLGQKVRTAYGVLSSKESVLVESFAVLHTCAVRFDKRTSFLQSSFYGLQWSTVDLPVVLRSVYLSSEFNICPQDLANRIDANYSMAD